MKRPNLHFNFIKSNIANLLLLELIVKGTFFAIIVPLFNNFVELVMDVWGQSYITEKNFISFLTYPLTIVLLAVTFLLISLLLTFEVITLLHYYHVSRDNKSSNLPLSLSYGLHKTIRSFRSGQLLIPANVYLIYIFSNTPLLVFIIMHLNLPLPSASEPHLKFFLILLLFLLALFTLSRIFRLPEKLFRGKRCDTFNGPSLSVSKEKGRILSTSITLMKSNLLMAIYFYLFYYVVLFISTIIIFFLSDRSLIFVVYLSVYSKINFTVGLIINMLSLIINVSIISKQYHRYCLADQIIFDSEESTSINKPVRITTGWYRHLLVTFIIVFVSYTVLNLYQIIRNDSFYLGEAIAGIQVLSHRGNSSEAPENTIPALEYAIEAMADYAEIDIRQTKDGVIILSHDPSLKRTARLKKYVYDLTYEELKSIDVGSWFSKKFKGTTIPTLEEVLDYCKGRIKLNIEIKISGHEQDLEEKLVELIDQYDFEHQCIISSTNYDSLVKIKSLNEELRTGYVLTAVYGNFYHKDYIDLFSIKSNYVTKKVVEHAHSIGKDIQVWTVNSTKEIERLKSLGVDGIVTDNPLRTRETLYSDSTNQTFFELLKRMMRAYP
ncbi:MAG: glycerophosphoryl diester phosphodiesterase [Herbinix sp.]|jgi:glycerophosphoryl diester phosphodiesterase|nr:glycerophosphoryl diester phosphodiesterase [Herbinix sp.]